MNNVASIKKEEITAETQRRNIFFYKKAIVLFLSVVCCQFSIVCFSQTSQQNKAKKEQLQTQMKKLQKEIADMEKQLESTSNKKKENLEQLEALKEKINKREQLIDNYNNQIGNLEENITKTASNIESQSSEIEVMKEDYANMIRKTYSNLALRNKWGFLFSSSTFNEAFARYNYLKKVADYRRNQAIAIQQSIQDLEDKKEDLEKSKQKKEVVLQQQTSQKEKLENEKQETDKLISQLSEREKKMRRVVSEKNKAAQALNNKIQRIIEDEIKLARKKAEDAARVRANAEAKKNNTTVKPSARTETILLSPKDQELSKDFAGNRGKLPWPVAKGSIVSNFGRQEHPTLKGIFTENNGIDIKTTEGANARSLFNGSVISVFNLPTTQNCVIVKHGEYFTVYSNIASPTVHAEDRIITKQNLGTLFTDKGEALTKVHLEIWKGKDKLNPAEWIGN